MQTPTFSPLAYRLLLALLVLVSATLICIGLLLVLRRVRQHRKGDLLPRHARCFSSRRAHDRCACAPATAPAAVSRQRPLLFSAFRSEKGVTDEKVSNDPNVLLPEIRIQFPDEIDDTGKQAPGKVVVVRIGETALGLEPLEDELPPYRPLRDPRVMEDPKEKQ